MTQAQLDRAVANATGESRRTISKLGFSLAGPPTCSVDRCRNDVAKFLDWDQIQGARYSQFAVF